MPTVDLEGEHVVVRFAGLDAVYALRRTVRIARASIVSVEVTAPPPRRGLRAPGTYVPGMVTAGTWRGSFGKDLWGVHRAEQVLVVELAGDAPFRRLVLEVDDAEATAAALPLPS